VVEVAERHGRLTGVTVADPGLGPWVPQPGEWLSRPARSVVSGGRSSWMLWSWTRAGRLSAAPWPAVGGSS